MSFSVWKLLAILYYLGGFGDRQGSILNEEGLSNFGPQKHITAFKLKEMVGDVPEMLFLRRGPC